MKEIKDLGFGIIQVNEPKPTMSKMESVDNYLCKWQKLKEWLKNQITDLRHIEIKTKTQSLRVNDAVNCFREVLYKMQELEQGGENEN